MSNSPQNQSDPPFEHPALPAAPCIVPADLPKRLISIEENVKEIKVAIIGQPSMGHRGLVQRIETVEKKVESHDRKLLVWGAIVTASLGAITFFKERLFR